MCGTSARTPGESVEDTRWGTTWASWAGHSPINHQEKAETEKEGELEKVLDCTKQKQEWDATDSNRKFTWT